MKRNLFPFNVILHPLYFIIGRHILRQLGVIINFRQDTIAWDDAVIPMKAEGAKLEDATQPIKQMLDAKYDAAELNQKVNKCLHLISVQKKDLFQLLNKNSTLFEGTLDKWNCEPYNIELKPDATL
jgi:hypothetical protein